MGLEPPVDSPDSDFRPWGYFSVLSDAPTHKVKRIVIHGKKRLSLQRHQRRAEHWFVVEGCGLVRIEGEELAVGAGRSVDIPRGAWHRISNPSETDLVLIEVQTGDYFGEDDIERREDDYGRT